MNGNNPLESKYYAFISYSHKDSSFARRLHRRLENYNISTITGSEDRDQRLFPICRDETAFSSGNLTDIIYEKLDESKKLIVICTKTAANSEYVCEEVRYFVKHYGIENVVPVVAEKYSSEAERMEMLPGILKDYADTKLAVYRYEGSWRQMFLKIVSGVLNVSYETIAKRDEQMRKKQIIIRTALFAIIAVILSLAALMGVRFFKTGLISKDVVAARELCGEDLYHGMKQLLELEKSADFWHIDKFEINEAIRENLNFEKGATLRINNILAYPDHKHIVEYEFVDEEKSMIIMDGIVYTVQDMKKVFEIKDNNIIVYYDSNGKAYEEYIDEDTFFLGDIFYEKDGKRFYFSELINSSNYVFDTEKKALIKDNSIKDMFVKSNTSVKSSTGIVFDLEEDGYFKAAGIKNCTKLQLSNDEKVLFVFTKECKLYAVSTETMKILYTMDIPYYDYNLEFGGDNKAAIYLDLIEKSEIFKENMFYIYFDVETGEVLDKLDLAYVPADDLVADSFVSHKFDISEDGKNILYSISDKMVVLKDVSSGEEQRFTYDEVVENFAFYNNGDIFRVFLRSGESHTVAARSQNYIRDMRCTDIICDADNLNNCIVAEGNVVAQPYNYGREYKVIFETGLKIRLSEQTKNYFLFYIYNPHADSIDDFTHYKCDKKTLKISSLGKLDPFELYSNYWDYEKDIVYDYASKQHFSLANNAYVAVEIEDSTPEGWTKVSDSHMIEIDGKTVYIAKVAAEASGKTKLIEAGEGDVDFRLETGSDGFVLHNDKCIVKYNSKGDEIHCTQVGKIETVHTAGSLKNYKIPTFDKTLDKVCYIDETDNCFKVIDINTGKKLYSFEFDTTYIAADIGSSSFGARLAMFNDKGDMLFLPYVDLTAQKCRTMLIDITSGKTVDVYDGYPVIFREYWTNGVLFDKSPTKVYALRARLAEEYNLFTYVPIFESREKMKDEVQKLLEII
ncbi:MAG: TIR domain-containing protein [Ruminococcaceae bacterium]|nr:TIR domain-containing protein [Oscillospiraceae bacterium]